MLRASLIALFLVGCGDEGLRGEGQPCNNSAECAPGLLCDYGQREHVCAKSSTVRDLATAEEDMADLSASGDDLSVPGDLSVSGDLSMPPDMAMPLPDLALTD